VPNGGGNIAVTWTRSPDTTVAGCYVLRQARGDTTWDTLRFAGRLASDCGDGEVKDGG